MKHKFNLLNFLWKFKILYGNIMLNIVNV